MWQSPLSSSPSYSDTESKTVSKVLQFPFNSRHQKSPQFDLVQRKASQIRCFVLLLRFVFELWWLVRCSNRQELDSTFVRLQHHRGHLLGTGNCFFSNGSSFMICWNPNLKKKKIFSVSPTVCSRNFGKCSSRTSKICWMKRKTKTETPCGTVLM